jgi:hypothetical protein
MIIVKSVPIWPVAVSLVLLASTGRAEQVTETYDSGAKKAVYNVAKGVRNGAFTEFYENGKTKAQGTYANGQLSGSFRSHHEDGKLAVKAMYVAGKLDGRQDEFGIDGKLVRSTGYRKGKRHGGLREFRLSQKVAFRQEYWIDGSLTFPRSAEQISAGLKRLEGVAVKTVGESNADYPGVQAALADKEQQADREAALRILMQYRFLCGVPYEDLVLDQTYNAHAFAAADICKRLGRSDHRPPNPGLEEAHYRFAALGAIKSNLAGSGTAARAAHAWMDDSDPSNIGIVGHRRWCLNPKLVKCGYGVAGQFVAMWSTDASRPKVPDFDFVAYPVRGLMPARWLPRNYAWSVSLNPEKFRDPDSTAIKIVVIPVTLVLRNDSMTLGKPLTLNHQSVAGRSSGWGPTVVFRPAEVAIKPGAAYRVQVDGLRKQDGSATSVSYYAAFY